NIKLVVPPCSSVIEAFRVPATIAANELFFTTHDASSILPVPDNLASSQRNSTCKTHPTGSSCRASTGRDLLVSVFWGLTGVPAKNHKQTESRTSINSLELI